MMQQDILYKLREAQRHLVDAARAIDGASVNIRTLLADINASQQDADRDDKGGKSDER